MLQSRLCACLVVGLGLLCPTDAQAARLGGGGNGAVVLRYHFVVGQRLVYRITTTSRVTTAYSPDGNLGAGLAGSQVHFGPIADTFLVRARVVGVDPTGTATIAEAVYRVAATITLRDAATIAIAPDGTQRRLSPRTRTSLTIPLSVVLPRRPVRPGAHWASTTVLSPLHTDQGEVITRRVTVEEALAGFGVEEDEPVAIIRGVERSHVHAVATAMVSRQRVRQAEDDTALVTERALLGLSSGALVSRQEQSADTLTFRSTYLKTTETMQIRITSHTLLQRLAT